jgi:hypothetical protein
MGLKILRLEKQRSPRALVSKNLPKNKRSLPVNAVSERCVHNRSRVEEILQSSVNTTFILIFFLRRHGF